MVTSFLVILSAGVLYAVLSPSYKAEMKILIRRGRIDPVLTPTQTVSPAFGHDEISEELSESESADLGVRASIAETTERTRALGAKLRDLPERRVVQVSSTDNQQLQEKLKSNLLELELRRTELLTKFQPSYRLVQEVNEQISQAKSAIEFEDLKPLRDETTEQDPEYQWAHSEALKSQVELEGLRKRHATAESQIATYKASAQKLGVSAIFQRDLEQKLKSAEEKYLLYANKREEARIGDSLDENGILNVAIAEPPHVPALPLWPLWTSVVSTSLAFAADYLDPSLRTPEDVLQVLGTPVLAALPKKTGSYKPTLRGL